jgi:uncharacterized protein YbjT (DUF2867 family)
MQHALVGPLACANAPRGAAYAGSLDDVTWSNLVQVLIAGATGYLGSYLVPEFLSRGHRVRALGRNPARLQAAVALGASPQVADVRVPQSLRGTCDNIEAVISAIGITRPQRGSTYEDVDYRGNLALLDEAVRMRVPRFLFVSVFDPPGTEDLLVVRAKRAFTQALLRAPVEAIVLRPTGYFSDMLAYFSMARRRLALVFGQGAWRINPIHGADVAAVCADALDGHPVARAIGGPETWTHLDIAKAAFHALARPAHIAHLPLRMAELARSAAKRLAPDWLRGPSEFLLTVLTRDMVASPVGTHRLEQFFDEQAARTRRLTTA